MMPGALNILQRLVTLLRFGVLHSLRDMWRNRSRTAFALVCVATGVAGVVALRTLAFMVGDELTTNLAQVNRGDLRITASRGVPELIELSNGEAVFSAETVRLLREWAAYEGVQVSIARRQYLAQIRAVAPDGAGQSVPGLVLFVEPETYPFYAAITLSDPPGEPLRQALEDGQDLTDARLVINPGLARAETLGLKVGDQVRVGSAETLFTVVGIAEPEAESVLSAPATAFFDYAYMPFAALPLVGEKPLPDEVYIKVPLGRDIRQVEASLIAYLQNASGPATDLSKKLNRASVPDLEQQNAETAEVIDDLILVMGLSALLIGGIGIVNTMLVVVSRRTLEIAVLKTLGLKAYRVTLLFLIEALLIGGIGSAVGVVAGVALSYAIRDVGEAAFRLTLEWRFYPAAATSGVFLGMVITALFGFLPTLIAGQVRPAIVLRPNEAQLPAAGLLQVLLTVVVMIGVLGMLVNAIVEGAIAYGPVYMFAGGGALVGLFAGVIVANTGLGRPIPAGYRFRLERRFERLENVLLSVAGGVEHALAVSRWGRWRSIRKPQDAAEPLPHTRAHPDRHLERRERGRAAITAGLRALRQALLLYGALAIGVVLASGIMLVVSEVWRPFGLGTAEPANDIYYASKRQDWAWVAAWGGMALAISGLVRWAGRALAGVIALSTLGVSLGGLGGWLIGRGLEAALRGSAVWEALMEVSTGVVLVEGALALLCAVYAGYWLLVWGLGKVSPGVLLGAVSLVAVGMGVLLVMAVRQGGAQWVWGIVVVAGVGGALLYRRRGKGAPAALVSASTPAGEARSSGARRGVLGALVVAIGLLGIGGVIDGAVVFLASAGGAWAWGWRALRRRYRTEGQLILREMAGRRGRVASTLLGLSVGIAGLSLVSLTSDAASQLLRVQIDRTVEGNLLVVGTRPEYGTELGTVLSHNAEVQRFTQFTTYTGTLLSVNGVEVERLDPHQRLNEEGGARENSFFERSERGIITVFSERPDLAMLPTYRMKEGRRLGPEDVGRNHVMLRESFFQERLDIHTGDRLLILFENAPGEADDVLLQLRVVGIISRRSEQTGLEESGNLFAVPPGTLSGQGVQARNVVAIAQVDDAQALRRVKASVSEVPGVLAFDLRAVTQLLENLIGQLKAIPALVAWLALLAGTAIIANTVALATQERRRQIGVMKAVGLKGWQVLGMLVVENGLIGFVAGMIGVTVGFIATVILVLASPSPDELGQAIDLRTMAWLVMISVVVAIGAALLAAWSAVAEKPMHVLRYE